MRASPQVGDSELRAQLITLLQQMDVECVDLPSSDDPVDAILRDAVGYATPDCPSRTPVIQLLRQRAPMQRGGSLGNPFSDLSVRHWLGITPTPDAGELQTTLESAAQGRFIPLTRLLGAGATIATAYEMDSRNKSRHVERLEQFFANAGLTPGVASALPALLEESLSNALYDAPVGDQSRDDAAGIARTERVRTQRPIAIRFGRSPSLVAISVRDFYGALSADRVIDRLAQCYAVGGAFFENKKGGAGLGFFFMVQNANRVVLNCKPGHFTELIVLRRIDQRGGEFRRSAPTLNICYDLTPTPGRKCHRVPVRWPAQHGDQTSLVECMLRDVTPHGAFLEMSSSQAGLAPGQAIRLSFLPAGSQVRVATRATTCWRGLSDEHCAHGVGVAFEKALPLAALFNVSPPGAFRFRGERFEVADVISSRRIFGRHPGEAVVHDFRVRTRSAGEYRLRYNWIADNWSVWAADGAK